MRILYKYIFNMPFTLRQLLREVSVQSSMIHIFIQRFSTISISKKKNRKHYSLDWVDYGTEE